MTTIVNDALDKKTLCSSVNPEHDWEEDFGFENGCYTSTCSKCDTVLSGYKRRVVCKICFNKELDNKKDLVNVSKGWISKEESLPEDGSWFIFPNSNILSSDSPPFYVAQMHGKLELSLFKHWYPLPDYSDSALYGIFEHYSKYIDSLEG